MKRLLVVNPGSTSCKLAVFEGGAPVTSRKYDMDYVRENAADLESLMGVVDAFLRDAGIAPAELDATAARGGLVGPVEGGTYLVDEEMVSVLAASLYGYHPSNLAAQAAHRLRLHHGVPGYVVDPVTVDELDDVARLTGLPQVRRCSVFHALNQKAAARRFAARCGKRYEDANLVVVHLGGGISVGAHRRGKVVDVNNALDGEGPMAPERAGRLPARQVGKLLLEEGVTMEEFVRMLAGEGGVKAHLGTADMRKVEAMLSEGRRDAALVVDAMAYAVAKETGSMLAALGERADGVVITGELARWDYVVERIRRRVEPLAKVEVFPGNFEMEALAEGVLRVLEGVEEAKVYRVEKGETL